MDRALTVNLVSEKIVRRENNPQRKDQSLSLYIGNLSFEVSERSLKEILEETLGENKVTDIRLQYNRGTDRHKGFAYADVVDEETVEAALNALNGKEVMGRPLRVDNAVRK